MDDLEKIVEIQGDNIEKMLSIVNKAMHERRALIPKEIEEYNILLEEYQRQNPEINIETGSNPGSDTEL